MIQDSWTPVRAANRQMPLQEAYETVELQRDLLMKFLTENKLLTPVQKSALYDECQLMKAWLMDHQIPKEDATNGQIPD